MLSIRKPAGKDRFFNWTEIGSLYLPNRSAQRTSLQPEHGSTVCMRSGICD